MHYADDPDYAGDWWLQYGFKHSYEVYDQAEESTAAAHAAAIEAAQGDSNDEEIESLWNLVEVLMGALQIEGEVRP